VIFPDISRLINKKEYQKKIIVNYVQVTVIASIKFQLISLQLLRY